MPHAALSPTAVLDVHAELVAVAELHGTPAYVYRPDVLAGDVARLRAAAAGFDHELRLVFALTSHHLPAVVDDLRCTGLGVDVGTADEYDVAVGARFCAEQIMVTGPCLSDGLLSRAVAAGAFLTLETPGEVDAAEESCAGRGAALPVGLRVAPAVGSSVIGSSVAREMVRRLVGSAVLELRGLHCTLAPELPGSESSLDALTPVLHLATTLRDVAPLDRVCVGALSGFAAPDLSSWFARLTKEWDARGLRGVALVIEPGPLLASRCVQILGSVLSVELREPRPLVTLDTGLDVLSAPTPGQPVHVEFVRSRSDKRASGAVMSALVVGPRRNESDVLRYDCPVPVDVAPGDLVLIHDDGRHGRAAAPVPGGPTPPVVRLCGAAPASDGARG
jgi:diaminopimelate decarboxylase